MPTPAPRPVRAYGDGGVFHRDIKSVQRTFPRTHTHPSAPSVKSSGFKGDTGEIAKLAVKSLAAFFGVPASYAAVPVTALFSDFGIEGERRMNPDRAAQTLGYKDAQHQQMMIREAKARGVK